MGTKAFEVNHLKVKTAELNKEKNVLSVALKSAKQEKRKERLQKKKERKKLAKQCSENNNNTNKDTFLNDADYSVENCKSTKKNSLPLMADKISFSDLVDRNPDDNSPNL